MQAKSYQRSGNIFSTTMPDMRNIAKELDEAIDILDPEDILDKYWKDLPDVVFEEAMATQEHSNQDVEFDPVEFRHQTEEWLDEVCQCF